MERFHVAYMAALCAQAGLHVHEVDVDDYGCDLVLRKVKCVGRNDSPVMDVQLKATSTLRRVEEGEFVSFDLPVGNYESLRQENDVTPKILVVLEMPKARDEWLKLGIDCFHMHNLAYWACIQGSDALAEGQQQVTVRIPASNVVTPAVLDEHLVTASGLQVLPRIRVR